MGGDPAAQAGESAQAAAQAAAMEAAAAAPVAFAKRKNRGTFRKRAAEDEGPVGGSGGGSDDGGVVRKAARRPGDAAPLAFSTKREDRAEVFKFESSGTLQQGGDGGATRGNEQETEYDRDSRALREQVLRQAGEGELASGEDGVYRGANRYKDWRAGFRREHTIGGEKGSGTHGPLRGSANVRMSVLIDYKPDLCKDYKETGYCGYGDSCKFLHDRGDYKAGWELDREWEEQQKAKREAMLAGWRPDAEDGEEGGKEEEEEEDDLPFACFICRRPWEECQDPVVTRCRHHFCEQCALQHNAKSKTCFVCEQPTGGIFNVAHDILRKEKVRKAKEAAAGGGKAEEKAEEQGGWVTAD